jgi:hypothetical protein
MHATRTRTWLWAAYVVATHHPASRPSSFSATPAPEYRDGFVVTNGIVGLA